MFTALVVGLALILIMGLLPMTLILMLVVQSHQRMVLRAEENSRLANSWQHLSPLANWLETYLLCLKAESDAKARGHEFASPVDEAEQVLSKHIQDLLRLGNNPATIRAAIEAILAHHSPRLFRNELKNTWEASWQRILIVASCS